VESVDQADFTLSTLGSCRLKAPAAYALLSSGLAPTSGCTLAHKYRPGQSAMKISEPSSSSRSCRQLGSFSTTGFQEAYEAAKSKSSATTNFAGKPTWS